MSEAKHEYPSKYPPDGTGGDLDEAWAILDSVAPGVIPTDIRAFLAGQIVGLLMRKRNEHERR